MHIITSSRYAIHTMSSTPPSRMPLIAASTRKTGSIMNRPPSGVGSGRSQADVRFPDEVLLAELVAPAFHPDASDFQEVGAVGQLQHLPHVLRDDQDGVALLPHA